MNRSIGPAGALLLGALALAPRAAAGDGIVDTGDTAWVLVATAMVMLMTPGVALFYGGMVRSKNVLGTMVQVLAVFAVVTVVWVVAGYSLAFGPDHGGVIGGLDWVLLQGVGLAPSDTYATTVPHLAFMAFQLMFAVITPALLLGAVAERMRLRAVVLLAALWSLLVYAPLAHWVWGAGGWLGKMGALDFAGGLVVHVASGVGGLAAALCLGKRRMHPEERPPAPHNLPLVLLGAALLWFGWFGFNAGSALSANGLAASAFVATHLAAAAAALGWMGAEWWVRGKPTALGVASGAVAGLVAVTPAAGFVGPAGALLIGLAAGPVCFGAVRWKARAGFDDSLDAWGIHGVGGTWGALATALFATVAVNAAGKNGLLADAAGMLGFHPEHAALLLPQLLGIAVAWGFAFGGTYALVWVVDRMVGARVPEDEEHLGLDATQHGEQGYVMCACAEPGHARATAPPPAAGGAPAQGLSFR